MAFVLPLFRVMFFALLLGICGCSSSLKTGNLSNDDAFQHIVGQELILMPGHQYWVLMKRENHFISDHSEGYTLYLVNEDQLERHMSPAPASHSQFVGLGGGARIQISQVHSYGMASGYPVALGVITLDDGQRFPFESEWRGSFGEQVQPVD